MRTPQLTHSSHHRRKIHQILILLLNNLAFAAANTPLIIEFTGFYPFSCAGCGRQGTRPARGALLADFEEAVLFLWSFEEEERLCGGGV